MSQPAFQNYSSPSLSKPNNNNNHNPNKTNMDQMTSITNISIPSSSSIIRTPPPLSLTYATSNLFSKQPQSDLRMNKPPSSTLVNLLKQRRSPPPAPSSVPPPAAQPTKKPSKKSQAAVKRLTVNDDPRAARFLSLIKQNTAEPLSNPPPTRRQKAQRVATRSASEEIPHPHTQQQQQQQQQYVISVSSLAHQHSVGQSADVVFLNGDMVRQSV